MSTQLTGHVRSHIAGEDMTEKQFYIVQLAADGDIEVGEGATDLIVGVLQNSPDVGEQAVYQFTGVTKVKAGGVVAVGDQVTSDTSGLAVTTTTEGDCVIGRFVGTAAAASGDLIEVQMQIHRMGT